MEKDAIIKFYDEHAEEFRADTLNVSMEHLYAPFLALIPPGGRILDAGCGVGRDSKAFLDLGYDVVSFDASERMVALAAELIGQPVLHLRFEDIDFHAEFDGIWACASLLHVGRTEIEAVISRLVAAVRPGGVLYLSFKYGNSERVKDGRTFNDYDEPGLRALINKFAQLRVNSMWQTADARPGRKDEMWLNAVVGRVM